ncbi:MAG TPA: PqqD family protein [Candidatus Polarisedimenticolaceae bacterium]|nr:PqqD family protein [Candidatus Polarisedimenticolaceae bacterium]
MNPRPAPGTHGRDAGDECLFRDADGMRIHVLNRTAREIYLLCDGSRTPAEVAGELADRYLVDPGTARADVDVLVELLVGLGILSRD